jgi:hypothetical protein
MGSSSGSKKMYIKIMKMFVRPKTKTSINIDAKENINVTYPAITANR